MADKEKAAVKYYVNKNKQTNGDHEVHRDGCKYMPADENRIYLGSFTDCTDAVKAAKKQYTQVNGCATCSPECHTQ
jgi:hypothetical protein